MDTGMCQFDLGMELTPTFCTVPSREAACEVSAASSAVPFLSLYSS